MTNWYEPIFEEAIRIARTSAPQQQDSPPSSHPALSPLNMSGWDDSEPEPLQWIIPDRIPRGQVGLFSGIGGTGKTTIELMRLVAHVTGLPFYNTMPAQGPVLYVGTEDPDNILRIRLTRIARYYNTSFADLIKNGLTIINLFGKEATMFFTERFTGRLQTNGLYQELYQACGDLKPVCVSLDPIARIFNGREIDRSHVYALVGFAQALAEVSGGSISILGHPSLSGIVDKRGYAGSTAWHDGFRFRQYLDAATEPDQEDLGIRQLKFMKIQYGPPADTITLRYQNGLFLPYGGPSEFERAAANRKADELFLNLLRDAHFNLSANPVARNYAPRMFAAMPQAQTAKIGQDALAAALTRLLKDGKIVTQTYGRWNSEKLVPA